MKKFILSIMAAAMMPVLAMAQGCPSSEQVTATVTLQYTLEHMLEGEFSVSQYTKVNFSQGNLQYKASAAGTKVDPNWRFAEHQWDYIGNAAGNTTAEASRATQSDWIDLFGWATSGNPASNCEGYQPWYTTATDTHYGPGTTSGEWKRENSDWGYVNAVQLGLGWRVMTSAEWIYLMKTRTASTVNGVANARFAKAYLFGTHHGIILFPDEYTHPDGVALPTGINTESSTSWNANTYSAADWAKMEAAGCVFLPAAGYRNNVTVSDAGTSGYYWTSTITAETSAYNMYFNSGNLYPSNNTSTCNTSSRRSGYCVRLVKNHQ